MDETKFVIFLSTDLSSASDSVDYRIMKKAAELWNPRERIAVN